MDYIKRARTVFDIEIDALRQTRARLDENFAEAVELIVAALRSRNKVIVTGVGKSGNLGHKIAATFTSTGTTSVVLDAVNALHGDLGLVTDGNCFIIGVEKLLRYRNRFFDVCFNRGF